MQAKKSRPMKQEEIWAQEYLRYLGFKAIEFEPHTSGTPDFLVDGRVAVEVRRLNQCHETEPGELQGIEEKGKPFIDNVQKELARLGPPQNGVSWYVCCDFERPLPEKRWQKVLRKALNQLDDAEEQEVIVPIDAHLCFKLMRSENPGATERFILAGYQDWNRGGFAVQELEKSLNLCITEKTAKIAPYRDEYPEWWLLLVDFMMVGKRKPVCVTHTFDKLIVLHPGNYGDAYEI